MAPTKCSYFMCNNTSKDFSMFRFPTGNHHHLSAWLKNCGNMTIAHRSHDELQNIYLCSAHFHDNFFYMKNGRRKGLSKIAVPWNYNGDQCEQTPKPSSSRDTYSNFMYGTPNTRYKPPLKDSAPQKAKAGRNEHSFIPSRMDDSDWNEDNQVANEDSSQTKDDPKSSEPEAATAPNEPEATTNEPCIINRNASTEDLSDPLTVVQVKEEPDEQVSLYDVSNKTVDERVCFFKDNFTKPDNVNDPLRLIPKREVIYDFEEVNVDNAFSIDNQTTNNQIDNTANIALDNVNNSGEESAIGTVGHSINYEQTTFKQKINNLPTLDKQTINIEHSIDTNIQNEQALQPDMFVGTFVEVPMTQCLGQEDSSTANTWVDDKDLFNTRFKAPPKRVYVPKPHVKKKINVVKESFNTYNAKVTASTSSGEVNDSIDLEPIVDIENTKVPFNVTRDIFILRTDALEFKHVPELNYDSDNSDQLTDDSRNSAPLKNTAIANNCCCPHLPSCKFYTEKRDGNRNHFIMSKIQIRQLGRYKEVMKHNRLIRNRLYRCRRVVEKLRQERNTYLEKTVEHLNPIAKQFFIGQIKTNKFRSNEGNRKVYHYGPEEKVLAIAISQLSMECYNVLGEIFTMPRHIRRHKQALGELKIVQNPNEVGVPKYKNLLENLPETIKNSQLEKVLVRICKRKMQESIGFNFRKLEETRKRKLSEMESNASK